ncbi:MAG: hypothetical protein ACI8TP_001846 [Acidimicrobiales bacterium]|jgi:hypothetical protein
MDHPQVMTADKTAVGWREWVGLPDLNTAWVKAKIDTGARSSALHAFDLETFTRDGKDWARFSVHPWQRSDNNGHLVETPIFEWRSIRSSSGESEERPVLRTSLRIGESTHEVDLTLARRDEMGFRMLVGREALRGKFVVDPARSYLAGKPGREVIAANRKRSPTEAGLDA